MTPLIISLNTQFTPVSCLHLQLITRGSEEMEWFVSCWLREIIVDNCVHGLIMLHSHLTWQPKYLSECELLHCIKCQASAGGAALEPLMLWESRMRENLELESWCHESMGDLILSFQVTRVKWHIAGYQIISCITHMMRKLFNHAAVNWITQRIMNTSDWKNEPSCQSCS